MRSYEEIRDEQARPVNQAIDNADRDLNSARQVLSARQEERRTLDKELQTHVEEHRKLDSPQGLLKNELADLQKRLKDLERQIDARTQQLRDTEAEAERLRQEITRQRTAVSAIDREVARASDDVVRRQEAVDAVRRRRVEVVAHSLRLYVAEVFNFIGTYATEATARERHERLQVHYDEARHSDPGVLQLHEERIELKRLLDSAQVPGIRKALEGQLRAVEGALADRFPGLLDPLPPAEDQEAIETYFWYDEQDDVTYLILPVPASCWHSPPEAAEDPRGKKLAQLLWGFVQALGDPVPSIELVHELVVLELLGDHTYRLGETFIEIPVSAGRTAGILPTQLPMDAREALS